LKKLIWAICGIVILGLYTIPAFAGAPTIDCPYNWPVTSDYGPRIASDEASWFHQGIDFGGALNEGIKAVEDGNIKEIYYKNRWYINIVKDSKTSWTYLHIFSDPKATTKTSDGKWEIRVNATLIDSGSGNTEISNIIINWNVKKSVRVFGTYKMNGKLIKNSDGSFIIDSATNTNAVVVGTVKAGDVFAPVGTSGGVPKHLHLSLNDGDDNPFYYVKHDNLPGYSTRADTTDTVTPYGAFESPESGHVFTSAEIANNFPIKVTVNSEDGVDLDKVDLWVYKNNSEKDENHVHLLTSNSDQTTFSYGGIPDEAKTNSVQKYTAGKTGVEPMNSAEGQDRFVYQELFSSLKLPSGTHALVAKIYDVNGNSTETRTTFTIVPDKHLIFKGTNNDNTVLLSNASGTPTPVPATTTAVSYAEAPAAEEVPVADFIKGIMYGATGGADFSAGKYKEGYKAIGVAAYTMLLHEQNRNYNTGHDILVNGYASGQKYFIPYKDYSGCTGTIKTAIDKAFSEISVTTTSYDSGNTVTSYYIKAYWMDNITATSKVSGQEIPDIKTLVFPYIDSATGVTHVASRSEKVTGEYISYLRETPYFEDISGITKPGDMADCTKLGMSAWGAMYMAGANTELTADKILNKSYHYEPLFLERFMVVQDMDSASGTTQTAYNRQWHEAVFTSGSDTPERLTDTANTVSKGVSITTNPVAYMYFSEPVESPIVTFKKPSSGSSSAASTSLPLVLTKVTDEKMTRGYACVYKASIFNKQVEFRRVP